ncbi:MAG: DUF2752 domain-containing protein [Clostridia bacterium]|nr:DUF2752 domain-containing protein [Clostridia bacterium]
MEKSRLKKLLVITSCVLAVGVAYYVFIIKTGLSVPCFIYELTGFYCAGCGITRMFVSLFRLDFISAAKSNIFALVLLLPTILFFIKKGREYIKNGKVKLSKTEKIIILLILVLALIFMVIRNF